jgi:hypothetical protein
MTNQGWVLNLKNVYQQFLNPINRIENILRVYQFLEQQLIQEANRFHTDD